MPSEAYTDPRLAAVYDALNPADTDYDFHFSLAGPGSIAVLDVGSGTGRLSVRLAAAGHRVVGAEPAPGMRVVAASRPGGDGVRWIASPAAELDLPDRFNLIVMTGHVFQVFLTDDDIVAVLSNLRRHLAPGGRIAFEARNIAAREWQGWIAAETRETVQVASIGAVDCHFDLTAVDLPFVTYETHFRFPDRTGHVATDRLRFHTPDGLIALVVRSGLAVSEAYGNFDRSPLNDESPEIVIVATATG